MQSQLKACLEKIQQKTPDILITYPLESTRQILQQLPHEAPYTYLPGSVTNLWKKIHDNFSVNTLSLYQHTLLLYLIQRFNTQSLKFKVSPAIIKKFTYSFHRIINISSDQKRIYDCYLKDLALCSGRIFPAGARLVEPYSSIQRALVISGGFSQALKFINMQAHTRSLKNFFRLHTHLEELEEFTPEGWQNTCLLLADMLILNPQINGLIGGSWFYDPAISKISPHLEYVQQLIIKNGGFSFYAETEGENSDSLIKSNKRRQAFNNGQYTPKCYVIIWPRQALLKWAKKLQNTQKTLTNQLVTLD
ncbi:hypothetical protein [Spartinivicinus ruber]|uniref:hypothetical protein n=1 Tax=Spartinivicinus ruber TaxID=2683272 RepID=UPI0013D34726|nr:hypothetical protein [Spartinivicinus ruber]